MKRLLSVGIREWKGIDIYAEDPGTTETVYGYVPIKVVNKLIKKHRGIIN